MDPEKKNDIILIALVLFAMFVGIAVLFAFWSGLIVVAAWCLKSIIAMFM